MLYMLCLTAYTQAIGPTYSFVGPTTSEVQMGPAEEATHSHLAPQPQEVQVAAMSLRVLACPPIAESTRTCKRKLSDSDLQEDTHVKSD